MGFVCRHCREHCIIHRRPRDHKRRNTIINKKHRQQTNIIEGIFWFPIYTHKPPYEFDAKNKVINTNTDLERTCLHTVAFSLKLKRSLGQEQTRQAKRRVVLPDLHMNGEEDERERTRRVETEHDRDERGVGVAGSGRLQPSSSGGLYQLQKTVSRKLH